MKKDVYLEALLRGNQEGQVKATVEVCKGLYRLALTHPTEAMAGLVMAGLVKAAKEC